MNANKSIIDVVVDDKDDIIEKSLFRPNDAQVTKSLLNQLYATPFYKHFVTGFLLINSVYGSGDGSDDCARLIKHIYLRLYWDLIVSSIPYKIGGYVNLYNSPVSELTMTEIRALDNVLFVACSRCGGLFTGHSIVNYIPQERESKVGCNTRLVTYCDYSKQLYCEACKKCSQCKTCGKYYINDYMLVPSTCTKCVHVPPIVKSICVLERWEDWKRRGERVPHTKNYDKLYQCSVCQKTRCENHSFMIEPPESRDDIIIICASCISAQLRPAGVLWNSDLLGVFLYEKVYNIPFDQFWRHDEHGGASITIETIEEFVRRLRSDYNRAK